MARTPRTRPARRLPAFLEPADGGVTVHPAGATVPWSGVIGITVMVALLTVRASEWWSWQVAVAGMAGLVAATVLLTAVPPLLAWRRHRGRAVPASGIRAVAGVEAGLAIVVAGAGAASAGFAAASDIQAGSAYAAGSVGYYVLAYAGLVLGFCCAATAAWLLRVAAEVETGPRRRSLGRLPIVLPVAIVGPAAAVVWSAPLIAAFTYVGLNFARLAGLSVGLVPLLAGIIWWPSLRAVCTTGLDAGRVRRIGIGYVVGGAVAGLAFAGCMLGFGLREAPGEVAQKVMAAVFLGPLFAALLAVPGWALLRYAGKLRAAVSAGDRA